MIICFTGNGKGKTTAGLGIALRTAGHQMKVCIIQFMKGTWDTGELHSIPKLETVEIFQTGKGFYKILDDRFSEAEHRQAAEEALHQIESKIQSKKYDVLILDEINVAVDLKLIAAEKILEILKKAPKSLHIVLTGRNAPQVFIDTADLVTEMVEVKHPFQKGIPAQKGIDF